VRRTNELLLPRSQLEDILTKGRQLLRAPVYLGRAPLSWRALSRFYPSAEVGATTIYSTLNVSQSIPMCGSRERDGAKRRRDEWAQAAVESCSAAQAGAFCARGSARGFDTEARLEELGVPLGRCGSLGAQGCGGGGGGGGVFDGSADGLRFGGVMVVVVKRGIWRSKRHSRT
jgi:hypothetical protein